MLYERWRQIAAEQPQELALIEISSGRRWTFAQLAAQTEQADPGPERVRHPQGMAADFVLEVLRAWRHHQVVLALEAGQTPPNIPTPPAKPTPTFPPGSSS